MGNAVSPALDPEVAALIASPGIPKIRVPHVASFKDRIGSLALLLLRLESDIAALRVDYRAKWASAELDDILREGERSAGLLSEKVGAMR